MRIIIIDGTSEEVRETLEALDMNYYEDLFTHEDVEVVDEHEAVEKLFHSLFDITDDYIQYKDYKFDTTLSPTPNNPNRTVDRQTSQKWTDSFEQMIMTKPWQEDILHKGIDPEKLGFSGRVLPYKMEKDVNYHAESDAGNRHYREWYCDPNEEEITDGFMDQMFLNAAEHFGFLEPGKVWYVCNRRTKSSVGKGIWASNLRMMRISRTPLSNHPIVRGDNVDVPDTANTAKYRKVIKGE